MMPFMKASMSGLIEGQCKDLDGVGPAETRQKNGSLKKMETLPSVFFPFLKVALTCCASSLSA